MKLYTEEQVRKAIATGFDWWQIPTDWMIDNFVKELTPIELPSDEEIEEKINCDIHIESDADFFNGAQWMRDKIQEK
jgi:hypothetical protein